MPTIRFTKSRANKLKRTLKKDLSYNRKYYTKYKDIKKYFKIFNKVVFEDKLSPFNEIEIKEIRDRDIKYCYGQVVILEWKRKGTRVYKLEMQPYYKSKKEFLNTLVHEMVHLYQMANLGDTGNHNSIFYGFEERVNLAGLSL